MKRRQLLLARLDEHSDLDFFVLVEPGAKERYLAPDLDWLERARPVAYQRSREPVRAILGYLERRLEVNAVMAKAIREMC